MELVFKTYEVVKFYPKDELLALTNQTKRLSISIATNIAEGNGRQYKKDTVRFLPIARGSLYELETQLIIGMKLKYMEEQNFECINILMHSCRKMLSCLINDYEKSVLR